MQRILLPADQSTGLIWSSGGNQHIIESGRPPPNSIGIPIIRIRLIIKH